MNTRYAGGARIMERHYTVHRITARGDGQRGRGGGRGGNVEPVKGNK